MNTIKILLTLILVSLCTLIIVTLDVKSHNTTCSVPSHSTECNCDNMGKQANLNIQADYPMDDDEMLENMKDYQIVLEDDGAAIMDGDRFVGYLPFNETCDFHKLMIKDNY